MPSTPANAINVSSDGVVGFNGTSFDSTAVTQHSLILGGATNDTLSNLGVATNGQIPIGSSGADPVLANITSTTKTLVVTNGAGTIDVETQTVLQTDTGFGAWTSGAPYYDASVLGTFTLKATGTGYINGVPVSWTQPQSVTGMTAGNTYYIYIDSTGTIGSTASRSDSLYTNYIVLFECLRDSTSPANNQVVTRENHPYNFPVNTSNYLHDSVGTVIENYNNGANIVAVGSTGLGISGNDTLADHGLSTAIADSAGGAETWYFYYTLGSGKWALYSSSSTFPNYWNNAGTPTVLTASQWTTFRLYVSKDNGNSSTPTFYAVMDNSKYSSSSLANSAIAAGTTAASSNELQQLELCQLGFVTYQNGTGIVTVDISKATIRSTVSTAGSNQASLIDTNTSSFTHWLSSADTTVQDSLNTLDAVGAGVSPQYATLVAGASYAIGAVSPSASSGVPYISQGASANPTFGTAVVAGGGTGVATMTTPYAPVCAGTTATNPLQVASTGLSSSGYVLTSNGSSALPSFQAAPGGSITITGDTGGGLTGTSFTLTGGTTGLTFAGSGSTETLGGDLIVANGGTGIATTTAFAPICGGTTATGAFQAATTGFSTSGYVLTSNGNAALPSFKATPSSSAFNVAIQTFTYTGSTQTYAPTSGMLYCQIEVCGGGGGGGGTASTSSAQINCAGGGGGGGYARGVFSAATIGASQAVTIGAGGLAGANTGGAGGTGGTTSVGSLISATGGTGGHGGSSGSTSYNLGGDGGAGSNGNLQISGSAGGSSSGITTFYFAGGGGSSYFGGASLNRCWQSSGGGEPGNSYGGGGGGANAAASQTGFLGGTGAAGIVIITEYIAIASLAQYITWSDVTGTSASMLSNHGYIADNSGLVTLTLPATAALGDIIYVIGKGSGGWSIAQNSGQTIHINAANSTTGTGGSAASTSQYNYVQLVCTVANTDFTVMMNEGIITLT